MFIANQMISTELLIGAHNFHNLIESLQLWAYHKARSAHVHAVFVPHMVTKLQDILHGVACSWITQPARYAGQLLNILVQCLVCPQHVGQ